MNYHRWTILTTKSICSLMTVSSTEALDQQSTSRRSRSTCTAWQHWDCSEECASTQTNATSWHFYLVRNPCLSSMRLMEDSSSTLTQQHTYASSSTTLYSSQITSLDSWRGTSRDIHLNSRRSHTSASSTLVSSILSRELGPGRVSPNHAFVMQQPFIIPYWNLDTCSSEA